VTSRAPLRSGNAPSDIDAVLHGWMSEWHAKGLPGELDHVHAPDERGHYHWLVRLRGDEKDVITIWFSLRQRTVHVECELMPAPEENKEALYAFLLKKNAELREVHLALGPEQGVYLVTQLPAAEITADRVDELLGAVLTYVDELFVNAMSLGYQSLYRRRKGSRS